ncbi:MAG TPA: hypothetical protein VK890_10095 [Bacteroidia bacterium]|jgi:hypothetical protein|nr:hypothetical protein [Bacteroidia bacterium]
MRITYLKTITCISVAASLALFSCHGNSNNANGTKGADSLTKAPSQKGTDQMDQDSETYLLPSPLQIASIFKNSGLIYMPGITAPFKDAAAFNSQYEQALNMGIYSADLSYCILNKQTDDAVKYLNIVKSLSDKLGFGSVFESNSFLKRFQGNMNSTDSLASLIAELQMETDTYLENNKQKYIGVIAFAGAWVESMHIGGSVYDKEKSTGVSSRICEQMNILEGLVKLLTKYQPSDSHIAGLVTELKTIKTSYEAFDEVKSHNPDSDELISLTPEHISQLGATIKTLRSKFVAS